MTTRNVPVRFLIQSTLTISLWMLVVLAFFPGLASNDSVAQIEEYEERRYWNTFPPAMALLWGVLSDLFGGRYSLLIFNTVLIFLGLLLLAWKYRHSRASWVLLLIPVLPWNLGLVGMAWKDVVMVATFFLATSMIVGRPSRASLISAALLLSLGSAMRWNAVAAAVPLIVLIIVKLWRSRTRVRLSIPLVGLLIGLSLPLAPVVANTIAKPLEAYPANHLFVDDLAMLSFSKAESLVPGYTIQDLRECAGYEQFGLRDNAYIRCLDYEALRSESLLDQWVAAVREQPLAWALVRTSKFTNFLRADGSPPMQVFMPHSLQNQYNWNFQPGPLFFLIRDYVQETEEAASFLFTGAFWLIASLAGLAFGVTSLASKRSTEFNDLFFIALSAVAYLLPYWLIAISGEYRMILWSTWAMSLWAVLFLNSSFMRELINRMSPVPR